MMFRATLHSLIVASALAGFVAACSSSSSDSATADAAVGGADAKSPLGALTDTDASAGVVATKPQTCDKSQIDVTFSPMYSAFDGVHEFQIPAQVMGLSADAISWSIGDTSIADLSSIPAGVMLTVQKAGTTDVIASAGTLCGKSKLTVTPATTEDWQIGSSRYTAGIVLTRGVGGRGVRQMMNAGPVDAACTSCHGESATAGPFKTVAHTPTQTGGFSDDELVKIFTEGTLPAGAYFDESIVSKTVWSGFHKWAMTDEQKKAMVVYLRSLTPAVQTGTAGGRGGGGDGGLNPRGDGGFGFGDARGRPGQDGGAP